ncbi:hypothetical protein NADFUDRAFT_39482 [Nadsonia fulvescens var. elongata DSM 6958]|uniref:VASt domain-containing protein n=1 Tax=Nadsonia fulvescens var. elongata DSM 6958 TaxID=857566 RepID=A0A1E3PRX6_9ASCO|nr:hypothetical protein NADFUDRAFT_39482 [Nadsonia fulvescens var. elongata DSM 6958]
MSLAHTHSRNQGAYNTPDQSDQSCSGFAVNSEAKGEPRKKEAEEEILLQYRKPRKDKSDQKSNRYSHDDSKKNQECYDGEERRNNEGDDNSEEYTTGHTFLTSVFSAAQTAANSISALAANTHTHARSVSADFSSLKPPGLFSPLLGATTVDNVIEPGSADKLSNSEHKPMTVSKSQSLQPISPGQLGIDPISLDSMASNKPAVETLGQGELSLESLGLTPEAPVFRQANGDEKHNQNSYSRSRKFSSAANSDTSRSAKSVKGAKDIIVDPENDGLSRRKSAKRSRASSLLKPEHQPIISESLNPNSSNTPLSSSIATSGPEARSEKSPRTIVRRNGSLVKSLKERSQARISNDMSRDPSFSLQMDSHRPSFFSVSSNESKAVSKTDKEVDNGKVSATSRAGEKRNNDFHALFKSVPEEDLLLDDFSCAFSREILLQGRLYVSQRHVCFQANILGWVTNLILEFEEIVAIEKRSTAGLFPNGIMIQTLHDRHIFASFIQRDMTYNFLVSVWKTSTEDPLHGIRRGGTYPESDEVSDTASGEDSKLFDTVRNRYGKIRFNGKRRLRKFLPDDETDYDDEISDESDNSSDSDNANYSESHISLDEKSDRSKSKKMSSGSNDVGGSGGSYVIPVLGPSKHAPTSSGYDPEAKNEKILCQEKFAAPLGVVSGIIFGNDTFFYKTFLSDIQKNNEVPDIPTFENSKRQFTYVKPLNGPIGPKQTRCICSEEIEHWNYEDYISILSTVQSPDVPSGNSFTVKTRYQLTWSENNTTKLVLSCWIEWTAKSWIKGTIEKGTYDGQATFSKDLVKWLNDSLKESPKSRGSEYTKKTKGNKRGHKVKSNGSVGNGTSTDSTVGKSSNPSSDTPSSLFADIPIIGPMVSVLIGLSMVWVVLITFLLSFLLFRLTLFPSSPNYPAGLHNLFGNNVEHLLSSCSDGNNEASLDIFENIRYNEEYYLWNWINKRVDTKDEKSHIITGNNYVDENYSGVSVKVKLENQEMLESLKLAEHNLGQLKGYVLNIPVL